MNIQSTILIAEDDDDDTALLKYAFKEVGIKNPLSFVGDGEELLNYLKSADTGEAVMPGLIFLDLNMPKIGGHEALKLIKENIAWCGIPVLVFSTSDFKEDIKQVYALGAASYIVKPLRYSNLLILAKLIKEFWIESVSLP
jgi:two-component system, response regulator